MVILYGIGSILGVIFLVWVFWKTIKPLSLYRLFRDYSPNNLLCQNRAFMLEISEICTLLCVNPFYFVSVIALES